MASVSSWESKLVMRFAADTTCFFELHPLRLAFRFTLTRLLLTRIGFDRRIIDHAGQDTNSGRLPSWRYWMQGLGVRLRFYLDILADSWAVQTEFIRRKVMSRFALFAVAIVFAAAYAVADTPTVPPNMTFRAFPPETKITASDKVSPYRFKDIVLVVIKDNVRCGQKPVNASFAIKGSQIVLHYDLTPAAPDAANCVLGSEFKIENVPDKEVTVAFSDGHDAAIVASMQKCPTYNPKTDDVWECMVPK